MKRAKKKATRSKAELAFARAWRIRRMRNPELPAVVEEYRFHPTRKWRFDFCWPASMLAVEIEGRGRHQTVAGARADVEKYNTAVLLGWRLIRFMATDKAKVNQWIETVKEALRANH